MRLLDFVFTIVRATGRIDSFSLQVSDYFPTSWTSEVPEELSNSSWPSLESSFRRQISTAERLTSFSLHLHVTIKAVSKALEVSHIRASDVFLRRRETERLALERKPFSWVVPHGVWTALCSVENLPDPPVSKWFESKSQTLKEKTQDTGSLIRKSRILEKLRLNDLVTYMSPCTPQMDRMTFSFLLIFPFHWCGGES